MRIARILLLCLAPALAAAQEPALPDPGMPEGAVRTAERIDPDGRYGLPVGPAAAASAPVQDLRGLVRWQTFRLDDPAAGLPAVIEGYRARLAAQGFSERFACAGAACGGLAFRLGLALLPPPAMMADAAALEQLSMSRKGSGPAQVPAHVSVLASRVFGRIHVQAVAVVPADPPPVAIVDSPPPTAAAPAAPVAGAGAMRERLLAEGHLVLSGLEFDTGGARLGPGSEATLSAVAAMLAADEALSVIVVGHSDNQGALDLNRDLSLERASAVRDALVERGIAPGRLSAEGVGFLAPITSNATEAGRAVNRRVDLVLR